MEDLVISLWTYCPKHVFSEDSMAALDLINPLCFGCLCLYTDSVPSLVLRNKNKNKNLNLQRKAVKSLSTRIQHPLTGAGSL